MINLTKYDKYDYPFPFIVIENFFDQIFLQNILNEFPKKEQIINFKKTMVNRRFLSNDNPHFYDYLKKNNFWFEFYNRINKFEFYEDVLNLLLENNEHNQKLYTFNYHNNFYKKNWLKFNISYFLKEITQRIPNTNFFDFFRKKTKNLIYNYNVNDHGLYLRFDISSASNGYFRDPHRDSDGTILAFLVYLEDKENIGGTGGNFLINDEKSNIIKSIEPKKNKAIFFLSNEKSYHSVSKIIGAKDWRKFIYGGFTSTNKKIWLKTNTLKN